MNERLKKVFFRQNQEISRAFSFTLCQSFNKQLSCIKVVISRHRHGLDVAMWATKEPPSGLGKEAGEARVDHLKAAIAHTTILSFLNYPYLCVHRA